MFFTGEILFLLVLARQTFASVHRVPAGFLVSYYVLMVAPMVAFLFRKAYGGVGAEGLGLAKYGFLLALGAGAAVLVHGYRQLADRLRGLGNHPLLILRVFGSDSNTAFVFGEILLRWCFLGSFATIADPSYVRFQGSLAARQNRRYFVIFTCVYVAWVAVLATVGAMLLEPWMSAPVSAVGGALGWLGRAEMASVATSAVAVPLLLGFVIFSVRRNFTFALKRLSTGPERPEAAVTSGGIFRRFVLYCHDDVWKHAVSSVLPTSEAVLMDLRGFTPERRGCEYELGLLIDHFSIDRVILLVDHGPAQEALLATLEERWALMSAESSNRRLENPVLTAYSPGVEDPGDIRRILALLTGVLPAAPVPAPSPAEPEALRIPGEKEPPKGRRGWADRFGRLDLAVSTPAVAKIFIPGLLAGLALYAYAELRPVAEAHRDMAVPRVLPVTTLAERRGPRPAAPLEPFTATARVQTNERTQVKNRFKLQEDLTLSITFQGGLMDRAHRGWISDLAVLGKDGRPLPVEDDFTKPVEEDRKKGLAGREATFAVTLHPPEPIAGIARVSGHVTLELQEPDQLLAVDKLDTVLPGRGWVQLAHPRLAPLGQVDLVRLSADDWLTIRQHGDPAKLRVFVLRPDGMSANQVSVHYQEYRRQTVLAADLPTVRLEIPLGAPRLEKVGFEIRDLPVLKRLAQREPLTITGVSR
jgi:hypothetical protein